MVKNTVTRRFIILPLLILLLPCSAMAQDEVPWLSLSRLSLSASTSYHFSPWKKYNESLQLAQDAIRYDPSYGSPRGSFEKILGDGSVELSAGYRLIEGLSVHVIGGYIATRSDGIFSYSILSPSTSGGFVVLAEQKFNQNVKLSVLEYGLGVQYSYEIFEGVNLLTSASALQAYGDFNFEYELQGSSTTFSYSTAMSDVKSSYQAGFGVFVRLYGPFSLSSSIEYRWLKFPDFKGEGKYLERYNPQDATFNRERSFPVSLGEADGYFGLYVPYPEAYYINEQLLHAFWARTPIAQSWYSTKKPATLDLSGIGIKAGVRFEF